MTSRKGRLVSPAEAAQLGVLQPTAGLSPVITGTGTIDYTCGWCELLLVKNGGIGQLRNVAIRCWRCDWINVIDDRPQD